MAHTPASLRWPLALAAVWLLSATLSTLAAPVLIATVPYWHEVRTQLAQLSLWQTWISIAACVGILVLSRKKHAETEEAWAQVALLIYVMGGMLAAIVIHYGVLPQWLVRSASLAKLAQVLALVLVHWVCALYTLRALLRHRTPSA